jgi:molybdopterin converting factor small subunit
VAELLQLLADRVESSMASDLFADSGGRLRPGIMVMVNGRSMSFLQGPGTVLCDGDEVLLLPAAAGG